MLFRDQFGYFHDVPDERVGWVSPGFGEVVYDGLGNPLGFPLLSLLPLAAQILPSLLGPSGSPSSPPAPAAPPPPPVASSSPPPVQLFAPSPSYVSAANHCRARTGAGKRGLFAAAPDSAACSVPSQRRPPPSHTNTGKGRALYRAGECAAVGVTGASVNGDRGERRDEWLVFRAVFRRLLLISTNLTNKDNITTATFD